MPSSHRILCHPLLLLPPIPPSIIFRQLYNVVLLGSIIMILNHCLVELSNTNLLSLNLIYKMEMSSVSLFAYLCLTLCKPMNCSTPGFPVHHQLPELRKLMSIESVMPSNHRILCHPLLLLPSIFSSIRVFSKGSVLHIRQPKYWSFSFSISQN